MTSIGASRHDKTLQPQIAAVRLAATQRQDWLSVVLKIDAVSVSRGTFVRGLLAASASAPVALWPRAATAARAQFVAAPNLFPENMAYLETAELFYVGSLRYGRVSSVDTNGKLRTLCDDPRLISTFGIFADHARSVVLCLNPPKIAHPEEPNLTTAGDGFDMEKYSFTMKRTLEYLPILL